jgi:predicted transcriptional regulator
MSEYEINTINNRGKIEIIADVVNLCTSGIKKTHIMYRGNLSFEQINRYLRELLKMEFVEQTVIDGILIYRATEKGRIFLHYYNLMKNIMECPSGMDMCGNEELHLTS